ncbi:GH35 family endo-1,4-beta-xylanase [Filimonas zeae]|uniref:glycosyl hydrolase 115 family protein n=1 Tax=Filimonas zeae TaxID=1737353 RepID=UPI001E3DCE8D|nr:glycosyl hydrolase 115 family protein [Filimonas zeae]MDR6337743.1 GH35 family endo-1,4-beta-xylanase [Filimonas zeae]
MQAQSIVAEQRGKDDFSILESGKPASIVCDIDDDTLVKISASLLAEDLGRIGNMPAMILNQVPASGSIIIAGSIGQSGLIRQLADRQLIKTDSLQGKWEAYQLQVVKHPFDGIEQALVIAGSDRRGVAYGIMELSRQMGVSPWYWWADVPVQKKQDLYIPAATFLADAPHVKYRGIFINDEAPCLSSWTRKKFGGFNHEFYVKVFELILRLKGNYLWPAMWGNAFNEDDVQNPVLADQWGIVMGTSHHEPMLRAQKEWRKNGTGDWNYTTNKEVLQHFWTKGIEKMGRHESVVTIGMRGDGDEPMTAGTATKLLEGIVADQRKIIETVTGKPASQTPQLWALYKEVQDYYDKGMRVADDVTLLLCDDNWGNLRKLPRLTDKPRGGGYGIYYHFDYVGGPRNYKWINTNNIARVWEQMHLAYQYGADRIWIVNVGDIKPMELPISFFLDYAWNPSRWNEDNINTYYTQWATGQFGTTYAEQISEMLSRYAQFSARIKPELLNAGTYAIENYNEAETVIRQWRQLTEEAMLINKVIAPEYKDAYFQLVLHPILALGNLHELYYAVAMNASCVAKKNIEANKYAERAAFYYQQDSLITRKYHLLAGGKWEHMMNQVHIGYTSWNNPPFNKMPAVEYVSKEETTLTPIVYKELPVARSIVPATETGNVFYEENGVISMEASHWTRALNVNGIQWKVIPGIGRTGSGISTFPVTASVKKTANSPYVEYDFYAYDSGKAIVHLYFSPTLNFHQDDGMKVAISVDNGMPLIITINKEDFLTNWERWVASNVILGKTEIAVRYAGKHTLKYWMVSSAVVLQKVIIDWGGMKPSYLGPPETLSPANASETMKGLKDYYQNYFPIGVAIEPGDLRHKEKADLICREFNSLTPENAMKMSTIHPLQHTYRWEQADAIVSFARQHQLKVRGHTLCWHLQTPDWMFEDKQGNKVGRDTLLQRLHDHIKAVVGRYKGQVYAWDVVNEAVADGKEFLRPSKWLEIIGEDYIAKAFQWAHEADPDAVLFYNDYNEISPVKAEKILQLLTKLKSQNVPVHGVGLQSHWAINEPGREQLDSTLARFARLGLAMQITELDISAYSKEHQARERTKNDSIALFTPEKQLKQSLQYKMCFEMFRKYRQYITGVTFWNLSDQHSWLDDFPVKGRKDFPLLFDTTLKRKEAYYGVVNW